MIYNFNHGIGWASSGVEYAQAYRANIFRKIGVEAKFVFTDMFPSDNLIHMTRNIGFDDGEIVWLYTYFTDQKLAPTTYKLSQLEEGIEDGYKIQRSGKICRLIYPNESDFYTAYMVDEESEYVHRVEVVKSGYLVRKDYYSYCRQFSEYYGPLNNVAHLYQRRFYNEDGSIAYEEYIDDKNVLYKFKDKILWSKEELVSEMVKGMQLSADDIVIIDRSTEIGQAILRNVNDARVGIVVHADHFSEGATDENNILWNNYYEYAFSQHKNIDFYITATDSQNKLIREQFEKYIGAPVNVVTIPVGSIDELKVPDKARKKHSLITASRLATEKHIDYIVNAVIKMHEKYDDITLDIYGKGGEEEKLKKLIADNDAQNYIRLCGHQNLADVYMGYEAYIAASTSEGFGLTLLEAIGSGLPLIGFDVRYGNQTFIEHEKSGFIIPINDKMDSKEKSNLLAEAIDKLYESDVDSLRKASYLIAERFLTSEVEKKWEMLIKER